MIQPKLCTASSYSPESNWARASASRTLRDSGSELAACVSRVTAAAALPFSSRSRPRTYQSYTSPCGRTSGGGGGASANGGRGGASSSQSSSRLLRTNGSPLPLARWWPRAAGPLPTSTMRTMTSSASVPSASSPVPEGLRLSPFRALRYAGADRSRLSRLLSPPYDVIGEDERRRLEASDPHNVVRLILPRDADGGPHGAYRAAGGLLQAWRAEGVLRADDSPALYVYEMVEGSARTR